MKSKNRDYKELGDKDLVERLEATKVELTELRINHTITPLDNSDSIKD